MHPLVRMTDNENRLIYSCSTEIYSCGTEMGCVSSVMAFSLSPGCDSTDPEELKTSEVAQQTLCGFIHSLMAQCLASVGKKLEKEVIQYCI